MRVRDVVRRLLPHGTGYRLMADGHLAPARNRSWRETPLWPPDVFAVAATLVNLSSCYARMAPRHDGDLARSAYSRRVRRLGATWSRNLGSMDGPQLHPVRRLWNRLWNEPAPVVQEDADPTQPDWWETAIELMAIADEACAGVGFVAPRASLVQAYALERSLAPTVDELIESAAPGRRASRGDRRERTSTLCILTPADLACVQPKSCTPQVGCTLRSLSHHLALLPGIGEVRTRWLVRPDIGARFEPLNVLIVPFPYHLPGECFAAGFRAPEADKWGHFSLRQSWIETSGAALGDFVVELVERATVEVGTLHGVVLPELALDQAAAARVAQRLAEMPGRGIEFFVTGVLARGADQPGSGVPSTRNEAFACLFFADSDEGSPADRLIPWRQSKHHRWKLERGQITRYHLGHALDPSLEWWEGIDLGAREVTFYHFRSGASLAVLICEDLARIDPVQPVIRAVGPNLVIALLLDGPQLEKRWPGRYATVLADDPGSAVLTLTSLGMIERSARPGEAAPRAVALWKDASGEAQPLLLPPKAQALVLTLSGEYVDQRTLDGRSDGGNTLRLSLTGVRGVWHRSSGCPEWAAT